MRKQITQESHFNYSLPILYVTLMFNVRKLGTKFISLNKSLKNLTNLVFRNMTS